MHDCSYNCCSSSLAWLELEANSIKPTEMRGKLAMILLIISVICAALNVNSVPIGSNKSEKYMLQVNSDGIALAGRFNSDKFVTAFSIANSRQRRDSFISRICKQPMETQKTDEVDFFQKLRDTVTSLANKILCTGETKQMSTDEDGEKENTATDDAI